MKRILAVAVALLFSTSVHANSECNDEVCAVKHWKELVCDKSSNEKQCNEYLGHIIRSTHYQGALALHCKQKRESGELEKGSNLAEKCDISDKFLAEVAK
ncbi:MULTISPECIES: hypothetical protein [Providencia]|uniref:hypothetical protein n=1 Tax=Providencia TaxID=586 RepID=UPI00226DE6F1|nr:MULTISPECIES: hypothetical protein [Providencia]MCX9108158.1 hypothetical protein [Providencia rettgeri]